MARGSSRCWLPGAKTVLSLPDHVGKAKNPQDNWAEDEMGESGNHLVHFPLFFPCLCMLQLLLRALDPCQGDTVGVEERDTGPPVPTQIWFL